MKRKVFNIDNLKNCMLIQRWDGDIGIIDLEYTIGTTEVIDYDFYNIPVGSNMEFIVGAGRTYDRASADRAIVFNDHKLKSVSNQYFHHTIRNMSIETFIRTMTLYFGMVET